MAKLFNWIASTSLILAGALIALKISVDHIYLSYFLFAFGHIIWVINFYQKKEYSVVLANLFFLSIDVIGIFNWIK